MALGSWQPDDAVANVINLGSGEYSVDGGTINVTTDTWSGLTPSQFFNDFFVAYYASTLSLAALKAGSSWTGTSPLSSTSFYSYTGTISFNSSTDVATFSGQKDYDAYQTIITGMQPTYVNCGFASCTFGYQPIYTTVLNQTYVGGFKLTADVPVPGPIAGSGPLALLIAGGGIFAWWRNRRREAPRLDEALA